MSPRSWFVHLSGETFGPLTQEILFLMIQQNRIQFADFVWTDGFAQWYRVSEIEEFAEMLPQYPSVPIPSVTVVDDSKEEEQVIQKAQTARVAKSGGAAAALKVAPTPAPAPAPKRPAPPPPEKKAAPLKVVPPPPPETDDEPAAKPVVRRHVRVSLDGVVRIEGYGDFQAVDISEGGVLIEATQEIPIGSDLKVRIESPKFSKPLDMNALVVREEESNGQKLYGIEFLKVNPAYKRAIASYVKLKTGATE